jgi:hypothetical protein
MPSPALSSLSHGENPHISALHDFSAPLSFWCFVIDGCPKAGKRTQ